MLTPQDLATFIVANGVRAEFLSFEQPTSTVNASAEALGVPPEQIIKSLVFLAGDKPHLVVVNGNTRVDYRKLADHWGLTRKRIRMARPEEVLQISGYPTGGVPPFGLKLHLPTLVEKEVLLQEVVYGGGGDERTLLRIGPEELVRVTRATVVDVVR